MVIAQRMLRPKGEGVKCAELVTVVQTVGLLTVILTGCYCDDQTDSSGSDGKWRV